VTWFQARSYLPPLLVGAFQEDLFDQQTFGCDPDDADERTVLNHEADEKTIDEAASEPIADYDGEDSRFAPSTATRHSGSSTKRRATSTSTKTLTSRSG